MKTVYNSFFWLLVIGVCLVTLTSVRAADEEAKPTQEKLAKDANKSSDAGATSKSDQKDKTTDEKEKPAEEKLAKDANESAAAGATSKSDQKDKTTDEKEKPAQEKLAEHANESSAAGVTSKSDQKDKTTDEEEKPAQHKLTKEANVNSAGATSKSDQKDKTTDITELSTGDASTETDENSKSAILEDLKNIFFAIVSLSKNLLNWKALLTLVLLKNLTGFNALSGSRIAKGASRHSSKTARKPRAKHVNHKLWSMLL
ncbi:unnamed protein product [Ceutorhynchus assimilis]|uniref:Uncharacterized protein n=1 Tax=Ceutorhynchus assimilis TaxID=467358 RepID=A0A9N9QDP3_9CUCU|nr:unnamed protein product [Ceutorhynchus assimilis]